MTEGSCPVFVSTDNTPITPPTMKIRVARCLDHLRYSATYPGIDKLPLKQNRYKYFTLDVFYTLLYLESSTSHLFLMVSFAPPGSRLVTDPIRPTFYLKGHQDSRFGRAQAVDIDKARGLLYLHRRKRGPEELTQVWRVDRLTARFRRANVTALEQTVNARWPQLMPWVTAFLSTRLIQSGYRLHDDGTFQLFVPIRGYNAQTQRTLLDY